MGAIIFSYPIFGLFCAVFDSPESITGSKPICRIAASCISKCDRIARILWFQFISYSFQSQQQNRIFETEYLRKICIQLWSTVSAYTTRMFSTIKPSMERTICFTQISRHTSGTICRGFSGFFQTLATEHITV